MKNYIKDWRVKRHLKGFELAKLAKISPSYLTRLEKGERPIPMELVADLCTILECEPHQLVEMKLSKSNPTQVDANLMIAVMGAVMEAAGLYKVKLNPEELGLEVSLMYNQAITSRLTVMQIREISKTLIKSRKEGAKAEPLLIAHKSKSA
jgi:DNA-binding Xre family transcriptional regulator